MILFVLFLLEADISLELLKYIVSVDIFLNILCFMEEPKTNTKMAHRFKVVTITLLKSWFSLGNKLVIEIAIMLCQLTLRRKLKFRCSYDVTL